MERYRPMMRLLSPDDLRFLRSQPGFTPDMVVRFRAGRCQIFRGYLRCLKSDFNRICTALKILMLQSQSDRPDLASMLMRSQVTFACGLIAVHFRLMLYRWGLGTVDVSSLMKPFDVMRLELRTLVSAPSAVGA